MTYEDPDCKVCGGTISLGENCTKYPDGTWAHYVCVPTRHVTTRPQCVCPYPFQGQSCTEPPTQEDLLCNHCRRSCGTSEEVGEQRG